MDDSATIETGRFVCDGPRNPNPFDGNGRSCGTCHVPGDGFGLALSTILSLPADDPLFFDGLDEDPELLRDRGLIRVIAPSGIDEFRRTPKLVHLQELCDSSGECDALGLLGDRARDLGVFSRQAIVNHMAKSVRRVPGEDFRVPTDDELDALTAYMLSDLVAGASK